MAVGTCVAIAHGSNQPLRRVGSLRLADVRRQLVITWCGSKTRRARRCGGQCVGPEQTCADACAQRTRPPFAFGFPSGGPNWSPAMPSRQLKAFSGYCGGHKLRLRLVADVRDHLRQEGPCFFREAASKPTEG